MAKVFSTEELAAQLPKGWNYDQTKKEISQEFDKGTFSGAVSFINKIAAYAESLDHHPDPSAEAEGNRPRVSVLLDWGPL